MGNATGKKAIYKGEKSGVLLSVLSGEAAELSCNGEALVKLNEKTADFKTEKHVQYWKIMYCVTESRIA